MYFREGGDIKLLIALVPKVKSLIVGLKNMGTVNKA